MVDETRELIGTRLALGGAVALVRRAAQRRRLRQPTVLVEALGDQEQRVNRVAEEIGAIEIESLGRRVPPDFEIFLEAVGELHAFARRSPVLGVLTIIQVIVRLYEVAHLFVHTGDLCLLYTSDAADDL